MRLARVPGRAPRASAPAASVALLAAVLLLGGCGALFGGRYYNFRAYYNTFYNAKRAFQEGERQLQRADQRVDRARFLPLFPTGQASAGAAQSGPFQRAIEKSADLLRERPDSKYVDDALLLIGKSYFYTGNYVGADQKFREALAAAEQRGAREVMDEARFWLGRTLGASRRFEEGAEVLRAGLEAEGATRRWRARLQLALGELHTEARAWEPAAAALRAGIAELRDRELTARAHFLLGQVLEAAGHPGDAADAYAAVLEGGPAYELAYAAELNRALALGLDAGRSEEALELLRRMRRDGKHYANRAEVELAYARALAAAGQTAEARARFTAVLYDRNLGGTGVRGEALYRYAAFFRDDVRDFVRAAVYFDSAAASARTEPGREELVTGAALTGVRRTADVYGAYAGLATRLREADSLLALGLLDEDAFGARVAALEAERRRVWVEEQRRLAQARAASGFGDVVLTGGGAFDPAAGAAGRTGEEDPAAGGGDPGTPTASSAAGFLGYRDIARLQQARLAFERVWGDRPLVPNWRRRTAIGGAAVAGAQGTLPTDGPEGATDLDGPPPLDLSAVPRTPEAQAALRTERAGLRYEIGNVLFLSMADADSAAAWYRLVVEEDAEELVAPRALYALAEVERARGRADEAAALYRRVIEATPTADIADQARERLGLPPREASAASDSTAAAEAAYAAARRAGDAGAYARAVGDLLALAVGYPDAPVAPPALLSAGAYYTEWAYRDSLDLLALPDSLVPPALRAAAATLPAGDDPAAPPDDLPPTVVPADDLTAPADAAGDPIRADQDDTRRDEREEEGLDPDEGRDPEAREREGQEGRGVDEEAGDEEAGVAPPGGLRPPPPVAPAQAGPPPATPPVEAPADSLQAAADASQAAADTSAAFGLDDLYGYVADRYAGTPYAERARVLRTALDARYAPTLAVGDSAAVVADSVVAADPEAFGLMGDRAPDPALGGYTWRVATLPTPVVAQAQLRNYQRRGFRIGIAVREEGGAAVYDLLVGQFASPADAEAVRGEVPDVGFSADVRLVPLDGLVVVGEEELDLPETE